MNELTGKQNAVELHFLLDVEDEWPPVAVEGVPCTVVQNGYRIDEPPFFVKGLSCGDVIWVVFNAEGNVDSWRHVSQSGRTTVWILRTARPNNIKEIIPQLIELNCRVAQLPQCGIFSVDVPADCPISAVDSCLAQLDPASVAVAYPSFRH